ncbi:MAG: BON domain-containing protein [Rhodospirillales bacterium]|jgi:osmotically-inducible protein OsmY|nr:BON domain-containing protein [Rhodospirillales bacterium]
MAASVVLLAACESTPTQESTGEYIDSTVISTKVRAKIADDPTVSIADIDVNAFKDTVQLSGFVNTPEEKARAGRIAASVEGVRNVENNITVK